MDGRNDPNGTLQTGELALDYLQGIETDPAGNPMRALSLRQLHAGRE